MLIGNKKIFAFLIDDLEEGSGDLQSVNIWINNEDVTYIDNIVYLPQFVQSLKNDLLWMRSNRIKECIGVKTEKDAVKKYFKELDEEAVKYRFLNYGPTTDDVRSFIFESENSIFIIYKLNDSITVKSISICKPELKQIYERIIEVLS